MISIDTLSKKRLCSGQQVDELRKPFLIIALILIAIAVLVEAGTSVAIKAPNLNLNDPAFRDMNGVEEKDVLTLHKNAKPGIGIPFMALLDGEVLFTAILLACPCLFRTKCRGACKAL